MFTNTIILHDRMSVIKLENVKILGEGKETNSYELKSISCQSYLHKAGVKKYKLTAEGKWISEGWVWFHQAEVGWKERQGRWRKWCEGKGAQGGS